KEDADYDVVVSVERLILLPLKEISFEKRYRLVSVAFASGPKAYDYLCSFDAKPDDQVVAAMNGKHRLVQVRKVTTVFEDELPLPLAKMSWVEKPD
ncbi:MAG: hypothetical protein IJS52_09340, partial [Bacilli bacterium]|nr:hypothetical protein [Bacilli bacterium]